MKSLLLFFFITFGSVGVADVCFTDGYATNAHAQVWTASYQLHQASWTCSEVEPYLLGMELLALTLDAGALYAACTGVGVPVTASLGVAGLVVKGAQMVVSRIPCEDTDEAERVKTILKETVCMDLIEMGIQCDPSKLSVKTSGQN